MSSALGIPLYLKVFLYDEHGECYDTLIIKVYSGVNVTNDMLKGRVEQYCKEWDMDIPAKIHMESLKADIVI